MAINVDADPTWVTQTSPAQGDGADQNVFLGPNQASANRTEYLKQQLETLKASARTAIGAAVLGESVAIEGGMRRFHIDLYSGMQSFSTEWKPCFMTNTTAGLITQLAITAAPSFGGAKISWMFKLPPMCHVKRIGFVWNGYQNAVPQWKPNIKMFQKLYSSSDPHMTDVAYATVTTTPLYSEETTYLSDVLIGDGFLIEPNSKLTMQFEGPSGNYAQPGGDLYDVFVDFVPAPIEL